MGKTIFRVKKSPDNPFVMIDKRPLENPALSWKAKGILAYLLSRPDDWVVQLADLVARASDGPAAIRSALKELRQAGHMHMKAQREGDVTRWVYEVYELPFAPDPSLKKRLSDFRHVENRLIENRQVENRTLTNKENTTKNKKNEEGRDATQSVFTVYEHEIGVLTPHIADELTAAEEEHGPQWVCEALKVASANGKRNWAYARAVLVRWKAEGYGSEKPKPATAAQPPALQVNAAQVEATRHMLEEKQKIKAVPPPPGARPKLAELVASKSIKRG